MSIQPPAERPSHRRLQSLHTRPAAVLLGQVCAPCTGTISWPARRTRFSIATSRLDYLEFARSLGYAADPPFYRLAVSSAVDHGVTATTVVIAPGCKTGEMAYKRWPGFATLAGHLDDVAVVGTTDDLIQRDGTRLAFPDHVKMLIDCLSIREPAEALAAAGLVIGNDSGLSHVAAAAGTPTLMLFGPTPDRELGPLPPTSAAEARPRM